MGYFSCNAECAIATCDTYNYRKNITHNKKKKKKNNHHHHHHQTPLTPSIRRFSYSLLLKSTDYFSASSFLGKGSHGSVYKATLPSSSSSAAIKLTTSRSELDILSFLPHHPHLVNLLGFSSKPDHHPTTFLLVFQFMPNGSLHDHLHSSPTPPAWTARTRFALHIARALHFLHSLNPPLIHRDVKSSNVLIDKDYNARLGDFGLAIRVEDFRVGSTPPAGTLGYLDPAYLAPGDLSTKSDVFSFGILLLEIISGRKAIDVDFSPPSVVDWAIPLIKKGEFGSVWDPRASVPGDWFGELAGLAVRCVRADADRRPGMGEVVQVLRRVVKSVRHAPCVWKRLRRGVVRVDSTRGDASGDDDDDDDVVVVVVRAGNGNGRSSSKVSSVPDVIGSEIETVGFGAGRSRSRSRSMSIGSVSEVSKVVRLSKSRSLGVLSRGHVAGYER